MARRIGQNRYQVLRYATEYLCHRTVNDLLIRRRRPEHTSYMLDYAPCYLKLRTLALIRLVLCYGTLRRYHAQYQP